MNKTLKYSHSKTCGIVKDVRTICTPADGHVIHEPVIHEPVIHEPVIHDPVIRKPVIKHVKPVSAIKQVKPVSAIKQPNTVYNTPPIITLEEMRHQYFNNAKQQRTQLIQKLFSNAI